MKTLATLFISLISFSIGSISLAQTVPEPPPVNSTGPTPKPQMTRDTIIARRKFYTTKYRLSEKKKLYGVLVESFGRDNTTENYANWLSLALRNHPNTRYFKIQADLSAGMHSWRDVWVYDRQIRQVRYLQRVYDGNTMPSKATTYRVYQNVDDAAIHVLAEDNQSLNKISVYTSRPR